MAFGGNFRIRTHSIHSLTKQDHYSDVIMRAVASQITILTIVYSTAYSNADQRKHQSSASLAFVQGIHRWPVKSPHKGPVTRKMFSFDDVIMWCTVADEISRYHEFLCRHRRRRPKTFISVRLLALTHGYPVPDLVDFVHNFLSLDMGRI